MNSRFFIDALTNAARPVVMEIKRTDGDGVNLLGERSVRRLVDEYTHAGAPCLSVVTGRWFGGTRELLHQVRALTELPILRKDFINRRAQLTDSRTIGASAVLLNTRLLPTIALRDLAEASLCLGLTPFIEVSTAEQVATVPFAADSVIAFANKDISNRERGPSDLTRGTCLLPTILATGTHCSVSASGIEHPAQAAKLLDAGFTGLLIATGLLQAASIESWCAEMDRLRTTEPY
ncbi:indole-3-glycerol-phosphate synthase [Mycobacterium haemophilum DSM 44634]|uniref:indole-3-glycerol-phosphate synthase n=1 Tax=Mycobacterium haemophilum TaxID=29311 RepID=UPI0006555C6D|nr:indole-3-glycerol-phosphate synthase [Mycobacterium haemophilum]AKN17784.1 indole-3-glycerol phosphate synthase [Mycobacterium haemophilum DSM 44634]MCV7340799.1 indole-3-glycerol-phosphate synthase [Mycobacterium haemophilum DSM 44634]